MEHVDPAVLALLALGEPADDDARDHLDLCAECASELASLTATVSTVREAGPVGQLVPAPNTVWERVQAELGLASAVTGDAASAIEEDVAAPAPPATLSLLRRRSACIAVAAAAGVVVGGAGGVWWAEHRGSSRAGPTVVAQAVLDPLPGWSSRGQAVVEQDADGTRTLVLRLDPAVDTGGFREVWLIDRDVTRLVSLGVLDDGEGRFVIPAGLDLARFPVVDVSEEPFDGNPAPSGDSITRGDLNA